MEREVLKLVGEMNCSCRWSCCNRKLHLHLPSMVYVYLAWSDFFSTPVFMKPVAQYSTWDYLIRLTDFCTVFLTNLLFSACSIREVIPPALEFEINFQQWSDTQHSPQPHQTLDYAQTWSNSLTGPCMLHMLRLN